MESDLHCIIQTAVKCIICANYTVQYGVHFVLIHFISFLGRVKQTEHAWIMESCWCSYAKWFAAFVHFTGDAYAHWDQIPGACTRTTCLYLFVSVLVRRIHEGKVFVCEALVKLHLWINSRHLNAKADQMDACVYRVLRSSLVFNYLPFSELLSKLPWSGNPLSHS